MQQPAPVTGAGAEVADVEARIHALKRFLDKGLITAVEHRIKLDALIAEYQANHPSIEDGLALLQGFREVDLLNEDEKTGTA